MSKGRAGQSAVLDPALDPDVPATASAPDLRTRLVRLLVALCVVGLLLWRRHPRAATMVAVVAGSLTLVTSLSAVWAVRIERWLVLLAAAVTGAIGFSLLLFQFYLVVTPLAMLRRLRGADALDLAPSSAMRSYWVKVPRVAPSAYDRPYAIEPQAGAAGHLRQLVRLAGLVSVLFILDVALGGWASDHTGLRRHAELRVERKRMSQLASWASAAGWRDEVMEARSRLAPVYVPFAEWREPDTAAEGLHIDGGIRRTRQSPLAQRADARLVYIFGGSTIWGYGARDEHTIPSEVADLLGREGIPAKVVNQGVQAYGSFQELIELERRLTAGEHPDLVVFYDGVNDTEAQVIRGKPSAEPTHFFVGTATRRYGHPYNLAEVVGSSRLTQLVFEQYLAEPEVGQGSLAENVDSSMGAIRKYYLGTVDTIEAVARAHGIQALFFWQPNIFTKEPLHPSELELLAHRKDVAQRRELDRRLAAALDDPRVHNLTSAIDGPDAIMIDSLHLNEAGNRRIAEAMLPQLRAALKRGAGP